MSGTEAAGERDGLDPEVAALLAGQSEHHPEAAPQEQAVPPEEPPGPRARSTATVAALTLVGVLVGAALLDPSGLMAPIAWTGAQVRGEPWTWLQYALLGPVAVLLLFSWLRRLLVGASAAAPRRWVLTRTWLIVVLAWLVAKLIYSVVLMAPALLGLAEDGLPPVASAAYLVWATGFAGIKALVLGWIPAAAAALVWAPGKARRAGVAARAEAPTLALLSAALTALAMVAIGSWTAGHWWGGSPVGYAHSSDWRMLAPTAGPGRLGEIAALVVVWLLLAGSIRASLKHVEAPRSAASRLLAGAIGAVAAGIGLAAAQSFVALFFGTDVAGSGDLWILPSSVLRLAEALSFSLLVAPVAALAVWLVSRARRAHWSWVGVATATAVAVGAVVLVLRGSLGGAHVDTLAGPEPEPVDLPDQPVAEAEAGAGAEGLPAPQRLTVRRDEDGRAVLADQAGAEVILRGVNVNALGDYYAADADLPTVQPLAEQDFVDIAALGFNAVRLVLSWSALEPEPGRISTAYIDRAQRAVGWAADNGIHVVLDLHQDAWGKSVAAGPDARCRPMTTPMTGWDGAAQWATRTDSAPACFWLLPGVAPNVQRAFTSFYTDRDGIEARLVEVWRRLGQEFGANPAVAGYDLLNEAGVAEQPPLTSGMLLGRFHARAIRAIRDGESQAPSGYPHPVFVEPSLMWTALGFDVLPPDRFTQDSQVVFAPHVYAESATVDQQRGLTLVGIERGLSLAQRAAQRWGVPLWVGEWAMTGDEPSNRERNERFTTIEDEMRIGSAVWVWKQACGNPRAAGQDPTAAIRSVSCPEGNPVRLRRAELEPLLRAYPRSAPGRITAIRSEVRRLQVDGDTSGAGPVDGAPDACRLDLWVPGETQPTIVDTTGVTNVRAVQVPGGSDDQAPSGGWRVTGCAQGAYRLTVS